MFLSKKNHDRREFFQRSVFGLASFGVLGSGKFEKQNFDRKKIFNSIKKGENSKKIGIIICARYKSCGGGKCLWNRAGWFGPWDRLTDGVCH